MQFPPVRPVKQSAQMVCSLDPTCPVIADADTG